MADILLINHTSTKMFFTENTYLFQDEKVLLSSFVTVVIEHNNITTRQIYVAVYAGANVFGFGVC